MGFYTLLFQYPAFGDQVCEKKLSPRFTAKAVLGTAKLGVLIHVWCGQIAVYGVIIPGFTHTVLKLT